MSDKKKFSLYDYDKQIAAAFKIDCEEFLDDFEKLKSLRYQDFARVWQMKNFTFVFSGQNYAVLLREMCENYFYIVKKFLMSPRNVFTQIGALYMLYGLYYKQPLKSWVKIRLTLDEFKHITRLMEEIQRQGQYEPVYIFAKMRVDEAFLYTALQKPLGPEDRFVKSYETYLDYTFNSSSKEDTLQKFHEEIRDGDLVKDLGKTIGQYEALMKKYSEKCPGLVPFTSEIIKDVEEACAEMDKKEAGALCRAASPDPELVKTVKAKAVSNKNAVYRAKREVKTAVDIDFGEVVAEESSDFDDDDDEGGK
ncbi:hypothetical protein NQ315_002248 [Exocentrus adspersus]|uniref:snRNA-activating protein complex subunit 1 n=1 Tax=Exocentrus adspersus TaxID=1586481 RepID=A0AAV8VU19_9CUCU|nr:hypothetical protein NQ315_002248 [Exocentrus adspersus]